MDVEASIDGAMRSLRQGSGWEALRSMRTLADEKGGDGRVRYATGIIASACKDWELAESELVEARRILGVSAQISYDQGMVEWGRGTMESAQVFFEEALEQAPAFPEANAMLGAVLLLAEKNCAAEAPLRKALRYNPNLGAARTNLANCMAASGDLVAAEMEMREALVRDPDVESAYKTLRDWWHEAGRYDEGKAFLDDLLLRHPDSGMLCIHCGHLEAARGNWAEAVPYYERAVGLRGPSHRARCALGNALNCLGEPRSAVAVLELAFRDQPKDIEAVLLLASALDQLGLSVRAVDLYEGALELNPESLTARIGVIRHRIAAGKLDSAEKMADSILAEHPANTVARVFLASILDHKGETSRAADILEKIIEEGFGGIEVIGHLLSLRLTDESRTDRVIAYALSHLEQIPDLPGTRGVHFGLGKALERRGRYDEAFEHISRGNAHRAIVHSRERIKVEFQKLQAVFHLGFRDELERASPQGDDMVFICGVPRSGTSLTEQVLASHSAIVGGGELTVLPTLNYLLPSVLGAGKVYPDFVTELNTELLTDIGAEYLDGVRNIVDAPARITDKLPGNFLNLGFIDRILPNAKILHCRRNPMDTCTSIFGIDFMASHTYAYDLENLGHYYLEYLALMDHWRAAGVEFFDVPYEHMVGNLSGTLDGILSYLGLEFEPNMLEFHKSERLVRTASFQQVRRPLYSSSVERWRRYEKQLQPLYDILGPATEAYLDEIYDR